MDQVKAFNDTAASYGLGVAVLLALVIGFSWILWRIGTRLIDAHERYLEATASQQTATGEELKKQTVALVEIKTELRSICKAQCPPPHNSIVKPKVRPT